MYVNVAVLSETRLYERGVALALAVAPKLVKLGARLHRAAKGCRRAALRPAAGARSGECDKAQFDPDVLRLRPRRARAGGACAGTENYLLWAAWAMIGAVLSDEPPHHLLLGTDACDRAMAKLGVLRTDLKTQEIVARAAGFLPAKAVTSA